MKSAHIRCRTRALTLHSDAGMAVAIGGVGLRAETATQANAVKPSKWDFWHLHMTTS